MTLELQPFDILCVAGAGRVSGLIRWATSLPSSPAAVSHVSFVVEGGDLYTAVVQEALIEAPHRIVRRTIAAGYEGQQDRVSVYRPLNLTARDQADMRAAASGTLGELYGFGNIGLQLVDALLSKALRHQVRVARRLASNRWHECCHDVALVWQAAGYDFGVDAGVATPDEIARFCRTRSDRYALVRELEPVPRRAPEARPAAALPELLPAS